MFDLDNSTYSIKIKDQLKVVKCIYRYMQNAVGHLQLCIHLIFNKNVHGL